jgi:hypothetical protein
MVEGGWGVGAICTRVPRGVGGWGPMAEAGKAHWRGVDIPCGCSFMFATAAITTRRRPSINTVNAAVVVHGMDGRPSVCVIRNVPSLCRVGPGARRACFPIIFFPPFEFIFLMIGTKLIYSYLPVRFPSRRQAFRLLFYWLFISVVILFPWQAIDGHVDSK